MRNATESIVLDASVALTWCYPDEHSNYAYNVLDALESRYAAVPSLWAVEIANALAVGERRHRLSASAIMQFLDLVSGLSVETDLQTSSRAWPSTLQLARIYALSAYDATYLELAMREKLPLATLDERLKNAAKDAGVKIFS